MLQRKKVVCFFKRNRKHLELFENKRTFKHFLSHLVTKLVFKFCVGHFRFGMMDTFLSRTKRSAKWQRN